MVSRKLKEYFDARGYGYDDGKIVDSTGTSAGIAEGRAFPLRDLRKHPETDHDAPERLRGFLAAIEKIEEEAEDVESSVRSIYEDIDTKKEHSGLGERDITSAADLAPGGIPDIIKPALEKEFEERKSTADEFFREIKEARNRKELERVYDKFQSVEDREVRDYIERVTGIREPTDIVDLEVPPDISRRPSTAWSKAEDRIDNIEARQERVPELSTEFIRQSQPSTVQSFAKFWEISDDRAREILRDKGFEIRTTESGQERFK